MKNKSIILFFLIFLNIAVFAQREANIWYFGNYAGVDFNSGIPIPLLDGALARWEGVATFSDSIGNLLFYTDGEVVWNSQHNIMPNGTGLLGHQSSTECAIIVPYPQNDSLFYIFTVDREGKENGLCYSIVNMNLNDKKGDITSDKNIQIITPVPEKVTAVKHFNNKDIWLITHGWKTDSFLVYKITPDGINLTPQIYEVGTRHEEIGLSGNNAVGYMRVSPDGSKIALVLQVRQRIEIFDFNNQTGEVSNPIIVPDTAGGAYGVEFSPDASKLYVTSKFHLYQINLQAGSNQNIINSLTLVGSSPTNNFFGALQLATDGKIYLAHEFGYYLGVINNPEENVSTCNFNLFGFHLAGRQSMMGLPNFIPTYFLPPDFTYSDNCFGDSTKFNIKNITGIDSVFWDFGEPSSGQKNNSKLLYPKHLYANHGNYSVNLKIYRLGIEYLKNQIIKINAPQITLGEDTAICIGDTLILNAFEEFSTYIWNDNSTDSILAVTESGKYWIDVVNTYTNCSISDTIMIDLLPLPNFSLGNDTSFCINDSLKIGVNNYNAEYLWNTNSTDSIIFAETIGEYWLKLTDNYGCTNSDTINLSNYQLPVVFIGKDTVICPQTEIELSDYHKNAKYLWYDNSTNYNNYIITSGEYWLTLTDSVNCKNSDTIVITPKKYPEFNLGNDTIICQNEYLILKVNVEESSYLWNDETTFNTNFVDEQGLYILNVTNICGTVSDSINIEYKYCGNIHIPNIITPNFDNVNDYFLIKGIENEAWKLEIYNRWGNLIFISEDYQNDWNAEKNTDGVYFYILSNKKYNLIYNGFVHVYK